MPTEWNDLAWSHVASAPRGVGVADTGADDRHHRAARLDVAWGADAAGMAYVLYQVPAMVAFHAADMLEEAAP